MLIDPSNDCETIENRSTTNIAEDCQKQYVLGGWYGNSFPSLVALFALLETLRPEVNNDLC